MTISLLCTAPIQYDFVEPFHCPLYELYYVIPKTLKCAVCLVPRMPKKGWGLFLHRNFLLSNYFLK